VADRLRAQGRRRPLTIGYWRSQRCGAGGEVVAQPALIRPGQGGEHLLFDGVHGGTGGMQLLAAGGGELGGQRRVGRWRAGCTQREQELGVFFDTIVVCSVTTQPPTVRCYDGSTRDHARHPSHWASAVLAVDVVVAWPEQRSGLAP
jgi:hypothetical protein